MNDEQVAATREAFRASIDCKYYHEACDFAMDLAEHFEARAKDMTESYEATADCCDVATERARDAETRVKVLESAVDELEDEIQSDEHPVEWCPECESMQSMDEFTGCNQCLACGTLWPLQKELFERLQQLREQAEKAETRVRDLEEEAADTKEVMEGMRDEWNNAEARARELEAEQQSRIDALLRQRDLAETLIRDRKEKTPTDPKTD